MTPLGHCLMYKLSSNCGSLCREPSKQEGGFWDDSAVAATIAAAAAIAASALQLFAHFDRKA